MIPLKREIEQIAKDKGIAREVIVGAVEEAMRQAARRKFGIEREMEARFNDESGEVELFEFRTVVAEVVDPDTQVELGQAQQLDAEVEVGDEIGVKIDASSFGRILAQTAKQVIIQRVRDAERAIIYEEYKDRQGEIANGIVRRFEKGALIVDLGRAEAVVPAKEQVPRENYRTGDRIRAFVTEVNQSSKGPQIILSRACTPLLNKLFELEVPEIYEGTVRVESVAREPGVRSKIAVASRDGDVDPVGACVGMKGSRVQSVVQELRGERIDIVPWSPEPARYVCSALSPAQVSKVIIDEDAGSMDVIVPDDQLSLAIGRRGQNVRLAVHLTGWKIDIKSESRMREIARWMADAVAVIEGWGEPEAEILLQQGITSLDDLAQCPAELLSQLPGGDDAGAAAVKARAAELAVEQRRREAEAEAEAAAEAEARAAEAVAEVKPDDAG